MRAQNPLVGTGPGPWARRPLTAPSHSHVPPERGRALPCDFPVSQRQAQGGAEERPVRYNCTSSLSRTEVCPARAAGQVHTRFRVKEVPAPNPASHTVTEGAARALLPIPQVTGDNSFHSLSLSSFNYKIKSAGWIRFTTCIPAPTFGFL